MRVFVTGSSGWIGSAVVPELIGAGHEVTGLARSDASAAALTEAGVRVHRGDLDDLDGLRGAAGASDGVIHLAFKGDLAFSGDFQGAVDADRRAVEALGEALTGSDRPLVIASVTLVLAPGRVGTEQDAPGASRLATEELAGLSAFTCHGLRLPRGAPCSDQERVQPPELCRPVPSPGLQGALGSQVGRGDQRLGSA